MSIICRQLFLNGFIKCAAQFAEAISACLLRYANSEDRAITSAEAMLRGLFSETWLAASTPLALEQRILLPPSVVKRVATTLSLRTQQSELPRKRATRNAQNSTLNVWAPPADVHASWADFVDLLLTNQGEVYSGLLQAF